MAAKGRNIIFKTEVASSFSGSLDITNLTYDSLSFLTTGQSGNPQAMVFSPDGLRMIMCPYFGTDTLYQYDLGVAWDISTAVYNSISFALVQNSVAITASPDGTRLYVRDWAGARRVRQYSLGTPWDLATIGSVATSPDVFNSVDSGQYGLQISPDGTKLFGVGVSNDNIYSYTMSTPWDITTVSYDSLFLDISSEDGIAQGLWISTDGLALLMPGGATSIIYQYAFTSPWDITTLSYTGNFISTAAQDGGLGQPFVEETLDKLYMGGGVNDRIYQYSLNTAGGAGVLTPIALMRSKTLTISNETVDITVSETAPFRTLMADTGLRTMSASGTAIFADQETVNLISDAAFNDSFLTMQIEMPNGVTFDGVFQVTSFEYTAEMLDVMMANMSLEGSGEIIKAAPAGLCSPDMSTVTDDSVNIGVVSEDGVGRDLFSNDDGTIFYMMGGLNNFVYQYTLGTAWDLSTASYASKSFLFDTQDSSVESIAFNDDGTIMYGAGGTNDTVYQYTLGTPWDVSTASYASKSVGLNVRADITPTGLVFSVDGTKMYVGNTIWDEIYEYDLGTPWDISTAVYNAVSITWSTLGVFFVGASAFNSEGTKLYAAVDDGSIIGVGQFTLATAWDLSSLTYDGFAASYDASYVPEGIILKPDCTKMYLLEISTDQIRQYSVSAI